MDPWTWGGDGAGYPRRLSHKHAKSVRSGCCGHPESNTDLLRTALSRYYDKLTLRLHASDNANQPRRLQRPWAGSIRPRHSCVRVHRQARGPNADFTLKAPFKSLRFWFKANIAHSHSRDRGNQTRGWSALWDAAQNSLWDRGKPSPALMDLIESDSGLIPQPKKAAGRKPRVLVPVMPSTPGTTSRPPST